MHFSKGKCIFQEYQASYMLWGSWGFSTRGPQRKPCGITIAIRRKKSHQCEQLLKKVRPPHLGCGPPIRWGGHGGAAGPPIQKTPAKALFLPIVIVLIFIEMTVKTKMQRFCQISQISAMLLLKCVTLKKSWEVSNSIVVPEKCKLICFTTVSWCK